MNFLAQSHLLWLLSPTVSTLQETQSDRAVLQKITQFRHITTRFDKLPKTVSPSEKWHQHACGRDSMSPQLIVLNLFDVFDESVDPLSDNLFLRPLTGLSITHKSRHPLIDAFSVET